MDTPDDLYGKFIGIMAGLPDDASKWSLPLCTTFFSALSISLQEKMDEDSFDMPSHSGLTSKKLQLKALCQVWEAAVKSFKALNDEEKRLRRLMGSSSSRIMVIGDPVVYVNKRLSDIIYI